MVRPYGVKGLKRKKKEKYAEEEIEQKLEEVEAEAPMKKAKTEDEDETELGGIPISITDQKAKPGVIFILERASLEVAKVGKGFQLLSSDEHATFIKRSKKNPADYRPDIAHQAILAIFDSQLAKAGRLKAVFVRTEGNNLIEIKPHVRIPRTYKRFCGLMLELLQKLTITAAGTREKLMKMVKNPVTQYLPLNSRKIGFSVSSEKLVDMHDYVTTVPDDMDLVFVVGAMSHGKVDDHYVEDYLSISSYPLSAACCIATICGALQRKWKIL
ncbi:ribosomal RNA small subunit methyltransferase nep-1 [Impatiens glandulifera]|uniref:ribosomal RNA small subunit methyltransferase nep-1 n=1 Tax=Impatiens glandulifera TaxID=253017 RepID=UPI001FB19EB6|nr:ribosomal RNA small subunit methyltransferase nep-1 [Impatiens glandulifera]XP_047322471.1 ribosomal RNA small subunit methyltransferase nep-1 [Impatiens glandulifera]